MTYPTDDHASEHVVDPAAIELGQGAARSLRAVDRGLACLGDT